jgi:hypothetical protein
MRHHLMRAWVRFCWGALISVMSALPSEARIVQLEVGLALTAAVSPERLLAQAEPLVQAQVTSTFDTQPDVRQISVYVFADYAGQSVPILLVQVDRTQWQAQPQVRPYSRYLDAGVALLALRSPRSPIAATRSVHTSSVRRPHDQDVAFRDD